MVSVVHGWLRCAVVVTVLTVPVSARADSVHVRFPEGLSRGFLVLNSENGQKIAEADSQQVLKGDRIISHLVIHFQDGSFYDEETTFSQNGVFRLLTDHVIQRGPSFKTPMETLIDTSKNEVTVRYQDKQGKEKVIDKHMQMPSDVSNGLLFTLAKDLDPHTTGTMVSYIAATPQPRIVRLLFKRQGEDRFSAGGLSEEAMHYIMSVELGGITGVVATVLGKKPPDTDIWIVSGEAPAYARSRGPLYAGGPVWTFSLVSPELPHLPASSAH